jgi:hypothetical protein
VTSTRTPMPMYLCLCIRAHVRKNIYPPPSAVPLFLSPPVHFRWHIFAFIREGQWTPSTSKIEEKRNLFLLGISAFGRSSDLTGARIRDGAGSRDRNSESPCLLQLIPGDMRLGITFITKVRNHGFRFSQTGTNVD